MSSNLEASVFVLSATRTPLGSFMGSLSSITAPKLGAATISESIKRSGLSAQEIEEVFMGEVLQAGVGQAPARQALIYSGIPNTVPAVTVNKVCGSGLQSIILGAQALKLGEKTAVVAGGMESMSLAPHLLALSRAGYRMGHASTLDSMIHDGLWDPYGAKHMGNYGDLCASEKHFSRADQDAFAKRSFENSIHAEKNNLFHDEIVEITIPSKKGDIIVKTDEGPSKVQFDKISTLKPAFSKDGSVTAANASTLNDGAASLVLGSEGLVKQKGLKPLAKIVSYAGSAGAPEWFTTAPSVGMKRALDKAGWSVKDVDLFEVNEAFAVVALAAQRDLEIPLEKLNVRGGAISLGHPIGCSGARIFVTLIHALRQTGKRRGVAGICIGGGESLAICVEIV